MPKFSPGSKVRRINFRFGPIAVGDEHIVKSCDHGNNLRLEGFSDLFDARQFVLVKEAEPVSNQLEVGKTYKRASGIEVSIVALYPGRPDVVVGVRLNGAYAARLYDKTTGKFLNDNPDSRFNYETVNNLIIPPPPKS